MAGNGCGEKQQLLLVEKEPLQPKTSTASNRFQVVRTADDGCSTGVPSGTQSARGVSEPPLVKQTLHPSPSIPLNSSSTQPPSAEQRKMSAAARFTVSGSDEGEDGGTAKQGNDNEDAQTVTSGAAAAPTNQRTVHFSVEGGTGMDRDVEDTRQSSDMGTPTPDACNSTLNLKSWRNMKTIEHPPIIDFYRNSLDSDGILATSRPSMSQLMHGSQTAPDELEHFGEQVAADEMLLLENGTATTGTDGDRNGKNHHHHHSTQPHSHSTSELQGLTKGAAEGVLIGAGNNFTPGSGAMGALLHYHTDQDQGATQQQQQQRTKFGWIEGVFFRCVLNIFGVMLYLRVSWVAGEAGLVLGCGVILLASLCTTVTALSTCAICTNGDVKGGGAYYLISRSLGPEFGGSIGLIFCIANAVAAAMYVVGFAETVLIVLKSYDIVLFDGGINDMRAVGLVTCTILTGIVFIGTAFESRMQMFLLVILTASILNFFIGSVFPQGEENLLRGITGYSWLTLRSNLLPEFREHSFFQVFAIYFPAATGIMAGANISGDLADPQRAIPIGTLLAIVATTLVYLGTVLLASATTVRDADGLAAPVFASESGDFIPPACASNATCPYGLLNHFTVLQDESLWGPLIIAGIVAATLSSALASLVSAPKVFQAVCKDRLFPKIDVFAKTYGKDEEPRRAYLLCALIALAMVLIGDLNAIAPIISNFFLASYALINYACFDNSFVDSPGFRPSFQYYNMWVSLAGSLLCIVVMFIMSWQTALITFLFFALLFFYLHRRKPDVNWGSSTQAHSYKSALAAMVKLAHTEEHVKNYRPQILVLTGNPAARPSLVDFVYNITKGSSLMICGYVVPYPPSERVFSVLRKLDRQLAVWLRKRHVKAFYVSIANRSLRAGAQNLLQVSGLGRLRPNIVVVGFKHNWATTRKRATEANLAEINDYFGLIQDAFDSNMGVAVLRNGAHGLDFSELMRLHNLGDADRLKMNHDDAGNNQPNPDTQDDKSKMPKTTSDAALSAISETSVDQRAQDGQLSQKEKAARLSHSHSTASSNSMAFAAASLGTTAVSALIPHSPLADDVHAALMEEDGDRQDEEHEGEDEDGLDEEEEEEEDHDEEHDEEEEDEEHRPEALGDTPSSSVGSPKRKNNAEEDVELGLKQTALEKKRSVKVESPIQQHQRSITNTLRRISMRRPTQEQKALLASIARFQRKVKKATIDVWWLYDDGGLTLLLPHLLTVPRSYLEHARLRVFTICTSSRTMEQEQRGMAALLAKFRISAHDVLVIPDIGRKPTQKTQDEFRSLIAPYIVADGADDGPIEGMITESELAAQKEKTNRQLRTAELLQQHSSNADLVVLTLPVPRRGLVSSSLYLAWLDMMTRRLPPTLLVRGNQQSVLTFYS